MRLTGVLAAESAWARRPGFFRAWSVARAQVIRLLAGIVRYREAQEFGSDADFWRLKHDI